MTAIRRILCPTDFSELSRRALRHAIDLARWKGCELVALHVHQPAEVAIHGIRGATAMAPDFDEEVLRRAGEVLGDFIAPAVAAGIRVRPVIHEGREVDEILHQIRAVGADLLVMGTHGRGGFERVVLGSVTERVLRKADCPVLVVPPAHMDPADEPHAGRPDGGPYAHIVCPVDFSDTSMAAFREAVALAKESGARLTLLHAVEVPHDDAGLLSRGMATDVHRDLSEEAIRRVGIKLHEATQAGIRADCVVMRGKAYDRILSLAEDLLADLIVMGVRGHASAEFALFGSTAQHVTRAAVCPVLTVHAA